MKVAELTLTGALCALTLAGCPEITPEPQGILTAQQINGSWEFAPESGGPRECYTFENGQIVLYSAFCDGVNDLRAASSFVLDGNDFSVSFPAVLTDVNSFQVTITVTGTVIDEGTIEVTATASVGGGSVGFRGTLRRT